MERRQWQSFVANHYQGPGCCELHQTLKSVLTSVLRQIASGRRICRAFAWIIYTCSLPGQHLNVSTLLSQIHGYTADNGSGIFVFQTQKREKNKLFIILYCQHCFFFCYHFSPIILLSTSSQLSPVGIQKYNKWTSVWTQKQLVENLHAAIPWLQSVSRHFTFPRETVCRRLGFLVYSLFQATWWKKHNIIAWHHRCVL